MRNPSYENDFDLHENETAYRTHFQMKGFALKLVLKQRHKRTRKRPVFLFFFWERISSSIILKKEKRIQRPKSFTTCQPALETPATKPYASSLQHQ